LLTILKRKEVTFPLTIRAKPGACGGEVNCSWGFDSNQRFKDGEPDLKTPGP